MCAPKTSASVASTGAATRQQFSFPTAPVLHSAFRRTECLSMISGQRAFQTEVSSNTLTTRLPNFARPALNLSVKISRAAALTSVARSRENKSRRHSFARLGRGSRVLRADFGVRQLYVSRAFVPQEAARPSQSLSSCLMFGRTVRADVRPCHWSPRGSI